MLLNPKIQSTSYIISDELIKSEIKFELIKKNA